MSCTCPICFEELCEKGRASPNVCDHIFCLSCLEKWSKYGSYCPVDRMRFSKIINLDSETAIQVKDRRRRYSRVLYDVTVYCEVCKNTKNASTLLLCDCCDLGYHCRCLTPPLKQVPAGVWYCPVCTDVQLKLKNNKAPVKELEYIVQHQVNLKDLSSQTEDINSDSPTSRTVIVRNETSKYNSQAHSNWEVPSTSLIKLQDCLMKEGTSKAKSDGRFEQFEGELDSMKIIEPVDSWHHQEQDKTICNSRIDTVETTSQLKATVGELPLPISYSVTAAKPCDSQFSLTNLKSSSAEMKDAYHNTSSSKYFGESEDINSSQFSVFEKLEDSFVSSQKYLNINSAFEETNQSSQNSLSLFGRNFPSPKKSNSIFLESRSPSKTQNSCKLFQKKNMSPKYSNTTVPSSDCNYSVFEKLEDSFVSSQKYLNLHLAVKETNQRSQNSLSSSSRNFPSVKKSSSVFQESCFCELFKHKSMCPNYASVTAQDSDLNHNPLLNYNARQVHYAIKAKMNLSKELNKIEQDKWTSSLKKRKHEPVYQSTHCKKRLKSHLNIHSDFPSKPFDAHRNVVTYLKKKKKVRNTI